MASILIVEDEDRLRRILMLNLMHRGYAVAEATSVATAIEALETFSEPFDLLLLDINLPDATGWDVLRHLQQRAEDAPADAHARRPRVIVMTAVRPAERRLDEFHPAAVLVKPFPIEALARLVARTLGSAVGAERSSSVAEVTGEDGEPPDDDTQGQTRAASPSARPAAGLNGAKAE